MLEAPDLNSFAFTTSNDGANPVTSQGTSVTPGASNVEGAWVQVASALAQDVFALMLIIHSGGTSAAQKDHLIDIGVDPAGGTSYTAIISNIVAGESAAMTSGPIGHAFKFLYYIKAGSTVAVRAQGSNATAGTLRAVLKFWGQPSRPECLLAGMFSETIGTITNSGGVAFTPGNAADGTWVSLGTTAKAMWWWQLCVQLSSATFGTNLMTYVYLAFGDATNKVIIHNALFTETSAELCSDVFKSNLLTENAYRRVPAGGELFVMGRCSAAPTSGWNAVAVGVGG